MMAGFRFAVRWSDRDVVQLQIDGSNGEFAGRANVYVGIGALAEAADVLAGFPKNIDDRRELVFGDFLPDTAGGAVSLSFKCRDRAGHGIVICHLMSDHRDGHDAQSSQFTVGIEPAAVDDFVRHLKDIESSPDKTAHLRGSPLE